MYARHRNGPGNGYRSNPMGMGGGLAASRISPESSMRAHRAYNSDYRNNNRGGYRRGGGAHSKQFQLPSEPPRRTDIFVEAGKLAAEYLVSKGVIPPNALSGKWRGESLKNKMSEIQGFRRPDEYNLMGTRNERERRSGSLREYESDSNKEFRRSGSLINEQEQPLDNGGNGGMNTSYPGEIAREDDKAANLESGLEKCNLVKDAGAKASSSSNEKNLISDGDEEMIERFDDADNIQAKEKDNSIVLEQNQVDNKEVTASAKEGGLVSEENVDLSKDLKFQNVPTVARSSSILEGSKNENDHMNEDAIKSEVSEIHVIDVANGKSAVNKEQEPDHGLSAFGSSNSVFNDRGEKRAIDDETDDRESFKKHKEWIPTMDSPSDPCLPLSNSMENRPLSPDQKNLNFSLFSKDRLEGFEFMQEKQLFPGSFKSFDLNLNGTCDVNENHDIDITSPSVSQTRKEVTPINVDLSMTKKSNIPNEIEVIDLDNDSAQEDKTFNNFGRREDAVFTDLESFPNNVHNANGNPGIQDGYGLMLSELLGNNSNCSSVPTDLNPLHNDIGLTNGEGILGDDDSIYMSLGEIPISFLSAWEQPTQDYGKPF